MKCRAIAQRTGERCRNEAEENGYCRLPAHQRQAAAAAAESSSDAGELEAPSWDSLEAQASTPPSTAPSTPPSTPASTPPSTPSPSPELAGLEAMFAELEQDQGGSVVDEVADAIGAAPVIEQPERLERVARRAGLELDEEADPDQVDAAAAERDELRAAAKGGTVRELLQDASRLTPERVAFYVRMVHNPILERTGKPPLSDEEVQEGSEILVEIIRDLRGSWVIESPYGRLALWVGTVWGVRYFDELVSFVMHQVRRQGARGRPARIAIVDAREPAAAAAPAAPAADPDRTPAPTSWAGVGFGMTGQT